VLAADALSVARLLAAPAFASALERPGWTALGLFAFAAASDFADGRVARRAGRPSGHGAVLDNVADVAFVLGGAVQGARLDLLSWTVPAAIGGSVAAYALASLPASTAARSPRLARSRIGHAAGVVNFALAGLLAGAVATPGSMWPLLLSAAGVLTTVVNVAAVVCRLIS
jgi:phosphatidylglycerophosphate synthase